MGGEDWEIFVGIALSSPAFALRVAFPHGKQFSSALVLFATLISLKKIKDCRSLLVFLFVNLYNFASA